MSRGWTVAGGVVLVVGLAAACGGVSWLAAVAIAVAVVLLVVGLAVGRGEVVAAVGPSPVGWGMGRLTRVVAWPVVCRWAARHDLGDVRDPAWSAVLDRLRRRLEGGGTAWVLGITTGTHEAGVAIVRASLASGIELVANIEEERFSRCKHEHHFPAAALAEAVAMLRAAAVDPREVEVVGSWDWLRFAVEWAGHLAEGLPRNLPNVLFPADDFIDIAAITDAPRRVAMALDRAQRTLVGLRHHDNHAAFSYGASPFAQGGAPTLVLVTDGMGDDGSLTAYLAQRSGLTRLMESGGFVDSLALVYQVISAGQGGWTPLSSEGRFMGAAAWGDRDRLTNAVYRRLRPLLILGDGGTVRLNRVAGVWHDDGRRPYAGLLRGALGDPIPPERRWNPDAVLDPDAVHHADLTRERLDQAAALQLVFEDAIVHVVDHLVRTTGVDRLVWTGGAALNCVASMHLLERFDSAWFARNLRREGRLRLWVPPIPSDTGVAAGAAWSAVAATGLGLGSVPLRHPFLNGRVPTTDAIRAALDADDLAHETIEGEVADLAAWLVSRGAILGWFHGAAETGPRALGHRSILADATRADALQRINERVKRREKVRPLAPMCTAEAAADLFELSEGAAPGAYDTMVLCVRARPGTADRVPAVVHVDGSARIQIVREEVDPLTHAFLRSMGRYAGVEVAVNTSLNVGAPIAHTPGDAAQTLRRARGMHGLVMVGHDGAAFLVWETTRDNGRDGGDELREWRSAWPG